ncbi:MAG: FtsX-like permease family protein [Chloroflexota bacterium]|nr:FtsX-like permease family protein [Chloroflexota bacterium]
MEKLFGIPIDALMTFLLFIFGLCFVTLVVSALRNKVMFKIAARNIPRRPAQTMLIVLGLMLAAMLFSASFSTGDTMTHSIRTIAVDYLGEVDILVQSEIEESSGQSAYFEQSQLGTIQQALNDRNEVDGIAPAIIERVPVVAPDSQLNEPAVDLIGLDSQYMGGFDSLLDEDGDKLSLGDLESGMAYISVDTAEELEVSTGDSIQAFLSPEPTLLTIAGIYEKGGTPSEGTSMVMPLSEVQTLMNTQETINIILITNKGDAIDGAEYTDAVMTALETTIEGTTLEAEPVKRDVLDAADEAGSMFSSIFLMLGQFSIAAGILLIFLIFVMLAAERKHELGIARAVGTQRSQVIRMFTYEGVLYALIAAAVGSALGLAVGWGMVRIMAAAFSEMEFELIHYFNPSSLTIAYTMGVLLTLTVVAISAWRVSNLNIIRAIRDIPEPPKAGKSSIRGLVLAIIVPLLGLLMAVNGIQQEEATPYLVGGSMVIVGLSLLARRFRLPDRAAYTIAGLGLLVFWLLPRHPLIGEMDQGMELFFLSGIMVVAGAVWVVIYNSDILLSAIITIFGRFRGLTPMLKTAVSYPMANRFRTGMALAMFSLVVFTLVVMSLVNHSIGALFDDSERLSGGFDIQATVNYNNPIPDINTAIEEAEGINLNDFEAIASISGTAMEMRQANTDQEWTEDPMFLQGVDSQYTNSVSYEFSKMAEGYDTTDQVWQALSQNPNLAIVNPVVVPSRVNYNMGGQPPPFQLEGFYIEDDALPEVHIEVRHPVTREMQQLHVIGVLESTAIYSAMVTTSQNTLNSLLPRPLTPTVYVFQTADGSASDIAKSLEAQFLEHGMNTTVIEEQIDENNRVGIMFEYLIQGFMGLGLIVGIAALGVIAARSVVERRQQIGMLRAIGFQQDMVQRTFLIESSFVALLGIGIGAILGYAISSLVVNDMSGTFEDAQLIIPWGRMIMIVGIAYAASLFTTYLPARQAAKVYPAEALRYE